MNRTIIGTDNQPETITIPEDSSAYIYATFSGLLLATSTWMFVSLCQFDVAGAVLQFLGGQ